MEARIDPISPVVAVDMLGTTRIVGTRVTGDEIVNACSRVDSAGEYASQIDALSSVGIST